MFIGEELTLDHLDRMTDSTGLIQHAIYSIPRRESGYTTDDNARALRLCARLWCRRPDERMLSRVAGYLSYLEFARRPGGGFHNFLSYQRHWLDAEGCGDCQGQAVLALAEVVGSSLPDDFRVLARELMETVLPTLADLRSVRSQAYVIQSWSRLWTAGVKDIAPFEAVAWSAAQRLVECYQRSSRPDWQWFESRMTYANAVLPHALFLAARRWPQQEFLQVAESSFAFLDQATTAPSPSSLAGEGRDNERQIFWPVGNNGWYPHGADKAPYDQQPVEAATMADAALAGFELLNKESYLAVFRRARDWFHGHNSVCQPLADVRRGACQDGLQPSGINRNQGAESTLAYLWVEACNLEVQHAAGEDRKVAAASAWRPKRRPRVDIWGTRNLSVREIDMVRESKAPNLYTELFRRHTANPILTARDWPYPAHTVFNAGACQLKEETILLARVEDRRGHSHLTVARSSDGVSNWHIDSKPSFAPDPGSFSEEAWGVEDPRLTWVEERKEWIIAYTAFSPSGPLVSLAHTRDFTTFTRLGPVMPPEDKDAAVFPRRFGNRYAMIHRPVSAGSSGAHIWLSFSPDLTHWGDHHILLHARRGAWWDANKIGLSPPPLETPEGWLLLYHGVRQTAGGCLYRLGLALLDLEDPRRVLRRSDEWIFAPEMPYERQGDVNGVVFPCGWILDKATGTIRLYYGGADSCLALATAQLGDLLGYLRNCPAPQVRKRSGMVLLD